MFKAAYSRKLTCHVVFTLADLLSGSKFYYFYGNFKRASASNYGCLKSFKSVQKVFLIKIFPLCNTQIYLL